MRKSVWLCGLLLALAVPAMAQEESPRFEVAGGYTYIRFNVTAKPTPPATGSSRSMGFNVNGGSGSVALNLNRWFGAVADLGYSKASPTFTSGTTKITTDESLFTYLFGPRLSYRGSRWTPFAQALFGGAHGSASARSGTSTASGTKDVFAFTVGGGLDANVSQHFAIRLIQAEYLYTNFTAPSGSGVTVPHQNSARLTFGIVIH